MNSNTESTYNFIGIFHNTKRRLNMSDTKLVNFYTVIHVIRTISDSIKMKIESVLMLKEYHMEYCCFLTSLHTM